MACFREKEKTPRLCNKSRGAARGRIRALIGYTPALKALTSVAPASSQDNYACGYAAGTGTPSRRRYRRSPRIPWRALGLFAADTNDRIWRSNGLHTQCKNVNRSRKYLSQLLARPFSSHLPPAFNCSHRIVVPIGRGSFDPDLGGQDERGPVFLVAERISHSDEPAGWLLRMLHPTR